MGVGTFGSMSRRRAAGRFLLIPPSLLVAARGGETATGGFTAPDPGSYTYDCTVAGHRDAGMEGKLVVT